MKLSRGFILCLLVLLFFMILLTACPRGLRPNTPAQVRAEFIEVQPGVRLHVRDWGMGKPVILIHGWPLSDAMYDYQMTELAQKGYRAISITLRGYGKSDQPWGPYNYDVFADDIKAILDQLDIKDATLGGFSMGGPIAIRYMTRHNGAHVAKLALFAAAAPIWTKRADYPYGLDKTQADDLIKAVDTDRTKLLEDFGKIFGKTEKSISAGLAAWLYNIGMEASPYAVAQSVVALRDTDLRPELSKINVPTAIFHAVDDKICPFAFAGQMAEGIKNSTIIRFENSGHGLFIEEKDKFNRELMKFVG